MKDQKRKQIKVTVDNNHKKIINEAFKLYNFNVVGIEKEKQHPYFFIHIDGHTLSFQQLLKVDEFIQKKSGMLYLNWIGINPTTTSHFKICIKT